MKDNQISQAGELPCAPLQREPNPPQRILVVEDDISIRQLSTEVLIHYGYEVDAAADGAAAWEALSADSYDLMITDLDMPGLSGLKLVKKLRAARMALPVILASGTMTPQELNRNPWLQLSGALLKPFPPDQLLQTVQAVLRATVSARSPREILLAAGSSGSAPPISRGEQIAPPPNWQSQPSVEGLRL